MPAPTTLMVDSGGSFVLRVSRMTCSINLNLWTRSCKIIFPSSSWHAPLVLHTGHLLTCVSSVPERQERASACAGEAHATTRRLSTSWVSSLAFMLRQCQMSWVTHRGAAERQLPPNPFHLKRWIHQYILIDLGPANGAASESGLCWVRTCAAGLSSRRCTLRAQVRPPWP
jgi:hypothetical protein